MTMRVPKWLEAGFVFFPAFQGVAIGTTFVRFVREPSAFGASAFLFSVYLVAPLVWFGLRLLFGNESEGVYRVGKKAVGGNLWLLSYQLQNVYTSFPAFERALRLVPGFYSAWLRLWGSRIGRKVNWTAECQIVDRGHLEVGDRAFFGNRSYLSAHALKKKGDHYVLYVKKIRIGADAMVSYASHVGPGVVVGPRAHVEAGSRLFPNMTIAQGERYAERERTTDA
jgi:acetyltransferase-like isoleucine patch superfamily enzyme